MKLVIVTSRFPFPIEKGDKLRIYHQIKYLARAHEILLISIVDELPSPENLARVQKYCTHIRCYSINRVKRVISALFAWINGKPAQVGYFYNAGIKKKVYQEIIEFQPDRIYCQLIRVSEYVKTLPYIKVLDYMDCFSSGMARQASVQPLFKHMFYKHEAHLTKPYERHVYSYFDETTIISERDKNELPLLSKNLVSVVSNGIDTDFFLPAEGEPDMDLVFVGNLGYKPNEQAVLKLLEWCRNSNFDRQLKVLIAGARPTPKILAINEPGWEIAGWVDDIREAYWRGKIFAAPLLTGSGLQNKLLEAMSCALPCISTNLVNASINATPGQDLFIADEAQVFANHVQILLDDKNKRFEIGKNARKFVLNNYQWSEFNSKLEQVIIHAKSKAQI